MCACSIARLLASSRLRVVAASVGLSGWCCVGGAVGVGGVVACL